MPAPGYCLEKNGGGPGFGSYINIIPDLKIGIVVLTNCWSPVSDIYENAGGLMGGVILEELIPYFEILDAEVVSSDHKMNLTAYEGSYTLDSIADFMLEVKDEGLVLASVKYPAYREYLVNFGGHKFGIRNSEKATHLFQVDEENNVISLTFGPFRLEKRK